MTTLSTGRVPDKSWPWQFLVADLVGLGGLTWVTTWLFGGLIAFVALIVALLALLGFVEFSKLYIQSPRHAAGIGGVVLLLMAAMLGWGRLQSSSAKDEIIRALEVQLANLHLRRPLFESMPADIDLLISGIRVSLKSADSFLIYGPGKNDYMKIRVTPAAESEQGKFVSRLFVDGKLGTNSFEDSTGMIVDLKKGTSVGPISFMDYELFFFVEEEHAFSNYVEVAVGRRRRKGGIILDHVSQRYGRLGSGIGGSDSKRPGSILPKQ
jgi:hypothetical protein